MNFKIFNLNTSYYSNKTIKSILLVTSITHSLCPFNQVIFRINSIIIITNYVAVYHFQTLKQKQILGGT